MMLQLMIFVELSKCVFLILHRTIHDTHMLPPNVLHCFTTLWHKANFVEMLL